VVPVLRHRRLLANVLLAKVRLLYKIMMRLNLANLANLADLGDLSDLGNLDDLDDLGGPR
jgi:hypothetical protein